MAKKTLNTSALIEQITLPIAQELGLELWDVSFEKEGSSWFLRVIIDKQEGVSFDDCEALSRRLDKLLDELDPIEQCYCLEVSSAGLGRELKKQKHFDAYLGSEVEILLIRPEDKLREFKGKLVSADEQKIIVQVDGVEKEFIHSKIACVRLYEDYNFGGKTNE